MRLRTFTAPDMPAAMRLVREALGEHAIILTSEPNKGKGVRLTAAVEMEEENAPSAHKGEVGRGTDLRRPNQNRPHPNPPLKGEGIFTHPAASQLRFELQNILRFHNVPELFVAKMMQKATDAELTSILALHEAARNRSPAQLFQLALEKLTGAYFTFLPLRPEASSTHLMLIGTPGAGKTLAIAKLATRLAMDKQSVAVFTTDTKRAGGVEQLHAFTSILGLTLIVVESSAELRQHIKALPAATRVLIDTAGCNPYDAKELDELKAFATIAGIEPVLLLAAGGDSLEAIDMVESFGNALSIKRLMITHADMARRFGGVLAAAAAHGLAFCHANRSSSIADPLLPVDGTLLTQSLLHYRS